MCIRDRYKRLLDTTDYVMGIKQSVGGIQALYADIMSAGQKGRVYAATDDMIFSCFELGAAGAISAILSLFPEKCRQMWECAQRKEPVSYTHLDVYKRQTEVRPYREDGPEFRCV